MYTHSVNNTYKVIISGNEKIISIPEVTCVFLPNHYFLPSSRGNYYLDFYWSLQPVYILNEKYKLALHIFILYKWSHQIYSFVTYFGQYHMWGLFLIVVCNICTFVLAVLFFF